MQTQRLVYFDWLRILAILGVLFFHSAMPYVADWKWHIKNNETSNLLLEFNFFISRFRMPLLFFISGAVTHVMLEKRSILQFISLRFRRLLIPLIFGMLLIVPIQVYLERLTQGFKGNFFNFYPSIFTTGPYPKGNLSWHHLWFIAYLFLYDVVFAPFFKWLNTNQRINDFFNWFASGIKIYCLIIPSVLVFALMVQSFPETNDLVNDKCFIIYWFLFLLIGFVCMRNPVLLNSLERNRKTSLTFAVLTIVIINYIRWNKLEPHNFFMHPGNFWQSYLYMALLGITAWLWVFALVGYGKKYLNKKPIFFNYANAAVYPFYILHQTVIVVLTYYVVQTSDTIFLKYIFTLTLTLIISLCIYHLFIRPYALMRFLFGAKKEKPLLPDNKKPVPQFVPKMLHTV